MPDCLLNDVLVTPLGVVGPLMVAKHLGHEPLREIIKKLNPQDATTNPSLLLKSANQKEYEHLVNEAITYGI